MVKAMKRWSDQALDGPRTRGRYAAHTRQLILDRRLPTGHPA
ncbi:hypothetical protein SANTM175S_10764 [Streptomyces antimycoticus]